MDNAKAIAAINDALAKIVKIDSQLNLSSTRDRFNEATEAIEGRYLQIDSWVDLSENRAEKLQKDIDNLVLDDEISRRLSQSSPLQE